MLEDVWKTWHDTWWTHSVDLVEGFPLLILDSQSFCGLDGPLHVARPHLQVLDVLIFDEGRQGIGILDRMSGYVKKPALKWVANVYSVLSL